ncbi:hypothetical protein [Streptomyces olivochromogenes]|uniref:Gram-positive cocci surface proteins LPxTG domain-containing protein n=1 Tax=Streptomyces olivochromogenes TaxID=1963 RepID=A0A250VV12_STROL|nr:hypothetical protein [Streptomyces olivochromogenes]KUN35321.1 hypothetical protein AQJ27_48485 [Streptomyces olivochromogenes]GAX58063.1 hypothetical protein SO3561_09634 [Streptomyces olivochromogenes]
MTPRLTAFRVTGLLLVLTSSAVSPSYAATRAVPYAVSYAADPAPSAGASRAGSSAGEGRTHPGREESPARDEDGSREDTVPTYTDRDPDEENAASDRPEATGAPEPSRPAAVPVQHNEVGPATPPEPVLKILPLGGGLILIGLGLGLAFLALRLRRG